MTRHDPAYFYFRADAQAQGYTVLADYFRDYGIVPPAPYGRPAYKDRELSGGWDTATLERLSHQSVRGVPPRVDKSWGEPGAIIMVLNRHWSATGEEEEQAAPHPWRR